MISERAPITNMYETVLFSGYGALVFALIFGHLRKEKLFLIVGLGYNVCTLFMISFANDMLPSAIGPLVPVLRDNFWLSTHVTTIILSYGALALSWILANVILIKMRFFSIGSKDQKYYADLIYACLKYGVVLLAAGIILGGVWADYSWGRFWGWDPKETWSLIVLCIYMAILHGKYTNWIPPKRFISLTAGAFMSVMMAWFGVNYILASGLHSYGFSQGGAIFLFSFFAVQILLIAVTAVGAKSAS
ncbi:MAG: cytochrome c biogenesis protein CcsA [Bdellovibrionales bacterium]|nr:cytochrome c biogenesis protein CcsA [Bdellovibrionales bacterium]